MHKKIQSANIGFFDRATSSPTTSRQGPSRARSNTAHSYYSEAPSEPEPALPQRPSIRSTGRVMSSSRLNTHDEERYASYSGSPENESPMRDRSDRSERPSGYGSMRSNTFQGPTSINRESMGVRKHSVPVDVGAARAGLRPPPSRADLFGDPSDNDTDSVRSGRMLTTPDSGHRDRSVSPAGSQGSAVSRGTTYSGYNGATGTYANAGYGSTNGNGPASSGRKGPPPPPPSRSKKPPPPPPMKRVELR